MRWMIYGATGFTGGLVARAAVRRGHTPILAGRNVDQLEALSAELGLEYAAFRLDDISVIGEGIGDVDLVYHAAGPFTYTSDPLIRACLATNTHYVDITGELNVFENTFTYDAAARNNGIALISGVGFDVVPSDCLAASVSRQIVAPTKLEIAILGFSASSAGTIKSGIEILRYGSKVRRDGHLVPAQVAALKQSLSAPDGRTYTVISFPWGDLSTAYRTTGIPDITSYIAMPDVRIPFVRLLAPLAGLLARNALTRSLLRAAFAKNAPSPDLEQGHERASYVWARATNDSGQAVESWLKTPQPYHFTAEIAVDVVEAVSERQPFGALSPAQAFGEDFALRVPGTSRLS